MATKLSASDKSLLYADQLLRGTDWSKDPSVLAYEERQRRQEEFAAQAREELKRKQELAAAQKAIVPDAPAPSGLAGYVSQLADAGQGAVGSSFSGIGFGAAQNAADSGYLQDRAQASRDAITAPDTSPTSSYLRSALSKIPGANSVYDLLDQTTKAQDAAGITAEAGWSSALRSLIERAPSQMAGQSAAIAQDTTPNTTAEELAGLLDASNQSSLAKAQAARAGIVDTNKRVLGDTLGTLVNQPIEGMLDAVGSVESSASILGGPVGVTAGGLGEYFRDYGQARRAGLSPEEAGSYSRNQAGVVGLTSIVPSGKLATVPAKAIARRALGREMNDIISSTATKVALRTAGHAFGEGIQEGGQGLAQLGINKITAETDDGAVGKFAESQLPEDVWGVIQNTWQNARAGFIAGGGLTAPHVALQVQAENAKAASDILITGDVFKGRAEGLSLTRRLQAAAERKAEADIKATSDPNAPRRIQGSAPADFASTPDLVTEAPISDLQFEQQKAREEAARARQANETDAQFEERKNRERLIRESAPTDGTLEDQSFEAQKARELEGRTALGGDNPADVFNQTPVVGGGLTSPARGQGNPSAASVAAEAERTAQAVTGRQEALVDVQKADKAAETAAKTRLTKALGAHQAARRKAVQSALAPLDGATAPEKADAAEAARLDFDAANPVPTVESLKAAIQGQPAPTTSTKKGKATGRWSKAKGSKAAPITSEETLKAIFPDATPEELTTVQNDSQSELDKLKAEADASRGGKPLPAASTKGTTKATIDSLVTSIAKNIGSKNANILAKTMNDGNVSIVPDSSYVPDNAEQQGMGFYHPATGKTFIVANQIDPANPVAEMLTVLNHEGRHAADLASKGPAILGNLVGPDAVKKQAESVRLLAESNNKDAKYAQEALRIMPKDTPEANKDLETVAYFANVMDKVDSSAGVGRRILTNLASGARIRARGRLGLEAGISVKDIGRIARIAIEEQAITGEAPTPVAVDSNALPMIAGQGATTFNDATNKYVGSVDGLPRFEIADNKAELTTDPLAFEELAKGKKTTLGTLLNHDTLYDNYGSSPHPSGGVDWAALEDTNVYLDDSLGNANASWDGRGIGLNPKLLNNINTDKGREVLRSRVLHEVQHAIQEREGFVPGANSLQFMPNDIVVNKQLSEQRFDGFLKNFDLGMAVGTMPVEAKAAWSKKLRDSGAENERSQKVLLLNSGLLSQSSSPTVKGAASRFGDLKENLRTSRADYDAALVDAQQTYERDYGEGEARNTEARSRLTDDELALNPPETTFGLDASRRPVSEMLDTRPLQVTHKPAPPLSENPAVDLSKPMPMAINAADVVVRNKRFWEGTWGRAIKANLDPSSGLGRDLLDRYKTSQGEASIAAQKGERAGHMIDIGMRAYAKENNMTHDDANEKLTQIMGKISELPNPAIRKMAYNKLVDENPTLLPLLQAQELIAENTRDVVRNGFIANPNPSKDDLAFYEKLLNNSYGYMTRVYKSKIPGQGTKYSKKLWSNWEDAQRKDKEGRPLTAAQAEAQGIVNDAISFLAENNVEIPSDENLGSIDRSRLEYLYDSWGKMPYKDRYQQLVSDGIDSGMTKAEAKVEARDSMLDELSAVAKTVDSAEIQERAATAARELLGLNESTASVPKNLLGAAVDRSIVRKRKDLPEPVRRLLGELRDPSAIVATTLAKQGEFIAGHKLINDIKENYNGKLVAPPRTTGDKFTVRLDGKQWGSLEGWMATPTFADVIGSSREFISSTQNGLLKGFAGIYDPQDPVTSRFLKTWRTGARVAKMSAVVYNPFATALNFAGSIPAVAVNGITNPIHIATGIRVAYDSIKSNAADQKTQLLPETERAIHYNILESTRSQEIKQSSRAHLASTVANKTLSSDVARGLKTGTRVAGNTILDIFANADAWVKVAAFENRIDILRKYYEATGEAKADEAIYQEAATDVKNSNISSDRVPPLLKRFERYGLTTYGAYFYGAITALPLNFYGGVTDIIRAKNSTNPAAKAIMMKAGIARATGSIIGTYGMVKGLAAIASMYNHKDDEDRQSKWEALKLALTDDQRFGSPIDLGKDEAGNSVVFALSRIDQWGPLNDILRAAMDDTVTGKDIPDVMLDSMMNLVFVNRMSSVLATGVSGIFGNKDASSRKQLRLNRVAPAVPNFIRNVGDEMGVSLLGETAARASDVLTPGWINALDPKNSTSVESEDKSGSITSQLIKYSGGRTVTVDPSARAASISFDLSDTRKAGRKAVEENMLAGNNEGAFRAYERANTEANDILDQYSNLYIGMTQGMGMSQAEAIKVLKDSSDLTTPDLRLIISGKKPSALPPDVARAAGGAINMKSLKERLRRKESGMSLTEKKAALQQIDDFIKAAKANGLEVEE